MATHHTKITHKDGLSFDAELQGYSIKLDADESVGGKGYGPTPKPLLLTSLAGCTGMDVAAILSKMQMPYDSFEVEVEGDTTDEHPKTYHTVRVRYVFRGNRLDHGKIEKAVKLSQEKYCGVSAMMKQVAQLDYEIVTNPE
ncbi:MAG: OsmC family protein [Spirochaetaceae bacterium]